MIRRVRLWLAFRCWALSEVFMDLGYYASEGRSHGASIAAERGDE